MTASVGPRDAAGAAIAPAAAAAAASPRPRPTWSLLLVLIGGLTAGVALARRVGAGWDEALLLLALAVGGSAVVVAGTVLALRRMHHRGLANHVLVVTLGAVAATASGVALAAWAMFLSAHDLGVLAVVLVMSATVAGSASWVLVGSFRRSVEVITVQVAALRGDGPLPPVPSIAIDELRHLSQSVSAAHDELVAARRLSARLEDSRREVVAWVSHDLRSPIGAVRAMAEALEDGVVTERDDVIRYHRAIRQETERLSRLVDDLFELSRIEAGTGPIDVSLVRVQDLVDEVVEAALLRANAHRVDLVAGTAAVDADLVIPTDTRRAIDNVVDNAIRHTPAGGAVHLRARTEDDVLVLVVSDQCGGIPDDDLGRIFEVAFRGDASRSRDTGGGGLGLAIAKGLLEAREGEITVRNQSPGCEFTLRLPATVRS